MRLRLRMTRSNGGQSSASGRLFQRSKRPDNVGSRRNQHSSEMLGDGLIIRDTNMGLVVSGLS